MDRVLPAGAIACSVLIVEILLRRRLKELMLNGVDGVKFFNLLKQVHVHVHRLLECFLGDQGLLALVVLIVI